jgi:hypothetical protein
MARPSGLEFSFLAAVVLSTDGKAAEQTLDMTPSLATPNKVLGGPAKHRKPKQFLVGSPVFSVSIANVPRL